MKNEKDIRLLATKVIQAEEAIKQKQNVQENKRQIESIINSLSVPELYELNDIVLTFFKGR